MPFVPVHSFIGSGGPPLVARTMDAMALSSERAL